MAKHDDFFTPERVDEQTKKRSHDTRPQKRGNSLVQDLHQLYQFEAEQDARSLQRAWGRIASQRERQGLSHSYGQVRSKAMLQSDARPVSGSGTSNTFRRRFSVIAAVVIMTLLVGSMIVVFNAARNGTTGGHGGSVPVPPIPATVVVTPTMKVGTTIYTYSQPNGVYALAWSPDGRRIASTGDTVQLWDATNGGHGLTYTPADSVGGSLLDVQWSPDGKRIASTSNSVQVWNAANGHVLVTYPPVSQTGLQAVTSSPLSSTLSSAKQLVPLANFAPRKPMSGGKTVLALAWSPDGQSIVSTNPVNTTDYSIDVWNSNTGALRFKLFGHSNTVLTLAWSSNGKYIASAGSDGIVLVSSAATGKAIYTYHVGGYINAVAWSPDSTRIASTDYGSGTVQVLEATTGKLLLTHTQGGKGVSSVAWSPGGRYIASGGEGVQVWDATTGKAFYTYHGNPSFVRTLAWSPDGTYIASGDAGSESNATGTVKVWAAA